MLNIIIENSALLLKKTYKKGERYFFKHSRLFKSSGFES